MPLQSLPESFQRKKSHILSLLSAPSSTYDDHSPKGTLDVAIVPLVESINAQEGFVTTSSCAGRLSVFLEGERKADAEVQRASDQRSNSDRAELRRVLEGLKAPTMALAGSGGKGGGGSWLFASHEALDTTSIGEEGLAGLFGLGNVDVGKAKGAKRFVHLKFEAMVRPSSLQQLFPFGEISKKTMLHANDELQILHIFTASLSHAQQILSAALQAGFRESGALNIGAGAGNDKDVTPMVAVRSLGLMLDSIIGYVDPWGEVMALVEEQYLRAIIGVVNERFEENTKRIDMFQRLLLEQSNIPGIRAVSLVDRKAWEDPETRRLRKRDEGLKRKEAGVRDQHLEERSQKNLEELEQTLLDNV